MKCFFMISGNMRKDALSMVKVSLKGGVIKEYESGITAAEVAKDLGAGLYKAACACLLYTSRCV